MSTYPGNYPARGRTPPPAAPANDYDQYNQYSSSRAPSPAAPAHQSFVRDRSPQRQAASPMPSCPDCQGELEVLTSQSEKNAGKRYWKCSDCDSNERNGWKGWATKPPIKTKPSKNKGEGGKDDELHEKVDRLQQSVNWIATDKLQEMSKSLDTLMFTMREILETHRQPTQQGPPPHQGQFQ